MMFGAMPSCSLIVTSKSPLGFREPPSIRQTCAREIPSLRASSVCESCGFCAARYSVSGLAMFTIHRCQSGNMKSSEMLPMGQTTCRVGVDNFAGMATDSDTAQNGPLFLTEWFQYRKVNDEKVALALGIDRTAVWKWRQDQNRLDPEKMRQLAAVLDCEPEDLWRHPDEPSADAILKGASPKDRARALGVLKRLVQPEE